MKHIPLFVIFTFAFGEVWGQPGETRWFSSRTDLCTQAIILDSTGLFFKEQACRDSALVSFGRYQRRHNTVRLRALPFDSIAPVAKVVTEKIIMEFDSLLTVTFYDRYNQPLALNTGVRLVDRQNKVHQVQTDENGRVEVNRFLYHRISIALLLLFYGESAFIDLARESLSVYLNLPAPFFRYKKIRMKMLPAESLLLKKDGLYKPGKKVANYKRQQTMY